VLHGPRLREIVDILLISFLIHRGVLLARGAAARRALAWLVALALTYWVALRADLALTAWALRSVGWVALVAFVILFRHEIREALVEAGPLSLLLGRGEPPDRSGPAAVAAAAFRMAEARTGALVVVQGRDRLAAHARAGVEVGAVLTPELLVSLFTKGGPLHDGAVVLRGGRVERAGAVLPLSLRPGLPPEFGTRHRAALGLTERTDAVVVVVSEERGAVSLVARGAVTPVGTPGRLEDLLRRVGSRGGPGPRPPRRAAGFARQVAGLVAVALAVSLFWWASDRGEPARTTVAVPVDFRNLPAGLELREPAAERVRVQVAGSRFLVEGLRPDQVGLHVDLRGAGPGATTVALGAGDVDLPPGLRVTGIEPPRVTVRLERRVRKAVPVLPVASPPPPAAGPTAWSVEPAAVTVIGPESAAGRLRDLKTKPLDLTGLRRSDLPRTFEAEVEVSPPSLRLAEGQPGRVRVTIRPGMRPGPSAPP
jgi:uncharacterized protein (TIGR00159 family)